MVEVFMPKMGDAMEEGTLLKWLKADGDTVKEGEPIAEIATDKATVEVEAPGSGTFSSLLYEENAVVPVGKPIAYILQEGEQPPTGGKAAGNGQAKKAAPVAEPPATVEAAPVSTVGDSERIKATPLVRRLAQEHHLDLRTVTGTGPGGRIVERDIKALLEGKEAAAPVAPVVPAPKPVVIGEPALENLPYLRKIIGIRTQQAKQTIPHFYLTIEVDMGDVLALRQQLNALDESLPKVSVNDLIVRASVLAIQKHPHVNSTVDGDKMIRSTGTHIGIAVAMPDGLVVPVIKHAEQKSLRRIADESRELIEKARAGKLSPDEMSGNTFTISNLGMYDIEEFSAIINPPASAILAVGSVRKVPVVMEDDSIQVRQRMKATLSCDHRVLDGASGALFLQDLKNFLQKPLLMLE
jgi:pyruvate dehydrogenase E2 component (dihydrolipoamide acetyltransferase)